MEAMEKFQPQEPGLNELRRKQAAENALFRVDIRRSLRLYRTLAVATATVVFLLLATLIALSKKHFSAECVVSVAPSAQHLMSDPNGPTWGSDSLTYDTAIDQQIQLVHRYDVLARAIASPGVRWREPKETEQAAVNRLVKALTVTRVEKSYQMAISVTATNPAQAVLLADAVAASFLEVSKNDAERDTKEHMAALLSERAQLQAALDAKIAEQSQILQRVHIAPGATSAVDNDYAGLSAAAAEAKVKHDAAQAQLQSLELPGAEAAMSSETSSFPLANSLQEKKTQLQAQMAGLTPLNPVFKADQVQLTELDQQISEGGAKTRAQALTREQSKARTELATETAQEAALTQRLAASAAKVSKSTPEIEQSNALATEITRLEVRYGTVDDRIRNIALDNGNTSQLELTSPARAPLQPNPNKRNLLLLLLLPGPLFAGIFAAVLALKIDPRIYSAADVEAVIGYPPFATLLHRKEASPEVMEEYLLRMAAGVESLHTTRGVGTILVTGNSPDSGASSIATALALKLQQVNRDSAVLDADADETSVTQEDIRALSQQHGLLLVDCPPILSSARAEYLARFTDAVLLVTESGKTTRNELRRAMKLLEKVNAGGVAVVLNKVTLAAAEDAAQSEVAEMEQRILERGSAGYTRPALRLYNTQAPERQIKTDPEDDRRQVEAPRPNEPVEPEAMSATRASIAETPVPVAAPEPAPEPATEPAAELITEADTRVSYAHAESDSSDMGIVDEIEAAPQSWPMTPPQSSRHWDRVNLPKPAPVVEEATQAVAAPIPEPVVESVAEWIPEPTPEPVDELAAAPNPVPLVEPIVEPAFVAAVRNEVDHEYLAGPEAPIAADDSAAVDTLPEVADSHRIAEPEMVAPEIAAPEMTEQIEPAAAADLHPVVEPFPLAETQPAIAMEPETQPPVEGLGATFPFPVTPEPSRTPHLVPQPETLQPAAMASLEEEKPSTLADIAEAEPEPEPDPVQPLFIAKSPVSRPVVPISIAQPSAASQVVPPEFARSSSDAPTTLQGVFGVRKKDAAPVTAMPSRSLEPEPESEEVADIWKVQPLLRSTDAQPTPEASAPVPESSEPPQEISIITPNQDPKPPRHTLVQPRDQESGGRSLFRLPWKKEPVAKPSSDVQESSISEMTEAEFIAPVKPLPGTPSVHETYVPIPSQGWLRGKKGNSAATQDKPAEAPKRPRNTEWMDRAEIERQILGNPRRKD